MTEAYLGTHHSPAAQAERSRRRAHKADRRQIRTVEVSEQPCPLQDLADTARPSVSAHSKPPLSVIFLTDICPPASPAEITSPVTRKPKPEHELHRFQSRALIVIP